MCRPLFDALHFFDNLRPFAMHILVAYPQGIDMFPA